MISEIQNLTFKNNEDFNILREYLKSQDSNKEFTHSIVPNLSKDSILGVRMGVIKDVSKSIKDNKINFLENLDNPIYVEEIMIYSFVLGTIKEIEVFKKYLIKFLKFNNSWISNDTSHCHKIYEKNNDEMYSFLINLINNDEFKNLDKTYIYRYIIFIFMRFYGYKNPSYLKQNHKFILTIDHSEYYVKMMIAWYLQTIYINNKQSVFDLLTELNDLEITKMTIQKIKDSKFSSTIDKKEAEEYKIQFMNTK